MSKDKKIDKKTEGKDGFVVMEAAVGNEMVISVKGEEGRVFKFSMPFFAPLAECYHASINVANRIAKLHGEAVEKQQKKDKESEKKDS